VKALTLQQPWASLMSLGLKYIETRSWPCRYRGPLVIHSSAKWNRDVLEQLDLARRPPILDYDSDWGRILKALDGAGVKTLDDLPLGSALCLVDVVSCQTTEEAVVYFSETLFFDDELAFGNFRPGRWAIVTDGLRRFEPIPFKGRRGLWEFPDAMLPEGIAR